MATKSKPTKKPDAAANGVPAPPADVLTLAEAAAFLRVSEDGLRADAEAGRVPGRVVAGEWRFVRPTLLEWLSQSEPRSGPARTNRELADHIRATALPWSAESEREAEEFIAGLKRTQKSARVGA